MKKALTNCPAAINTSDDALERILRQQEHDRASIRERILQDWQHAIAVRFPDLETQKIIELAWAAGFFDGEGHVRSSTKGRFNCEIDQVDETNLHRFQRAVGGLGTITHRKWRRKGEERPRFRWRLSNQRELQMLWNAIGLFLCPAKQRGFADALTMPYLAELNLFGEIG